MISKTMPRKTLGLTLLETTIVLVILALVLGIFLTPLAISIESANRQETANMLSEIKDNLIGYTLINGNLPCPDQGNDGIEDRLVNGTCSVVSGNVPWVDLGISENDAWGNPFFYQVTAQFADTAIDCNNPPSGVTEQQCNTIQIPETDCSNLPNGFGTVTEGICNEIKDRPFGTPDCTEPRLSPEVSFCLDSARDDGNININDDADRDPDAVPPPPPPSPVAQSVPALIASFGQNGAITANLSPAEQENRDGDLTFVFTDYKRQAGAEFDDLLLWITPGELINQMVKAERLP